MSWKQKFTVKHNKTYEFLLMITIIVRFEKITTSNEARLNIGVTNAAEDCGEDGEILYPGPSECQ